MKFLLLFTIGLTYLAFNVINLDTVDNNSNLNYRSVLENFVSSETVDKINSITSNNSYKEKLYTEANFDDTGLGLTNSKEGFKKPYLFFIFLKDIAIYFLIPFALFILFKIRSMKLFIAVGTLGAGYIVYSFVSIIFIFKVFALVSLIYLFHYIYTYPTKDNNKTRAVA